MVHMGLPHRIFLQESRVALALEASSCRNVPDKVQLLGIKPQVA